MIRCDFTKRLYLGSYKMFVPTKENRIQLLEEIFKVNPHYKFKWRTAEDYLDCTSFFNENEVYSIEYAEELVIEMMELHNACWPFSKAEYYNPYYEMEKEEFEKLAKETEEMYNKSIKKQ